MSGSHGCGAWKQSKKTKGWIKYVDLGNDKYGNKIFTAVTSTRTQPTHRRGVSKTWSGALQKGRNVYLSGGPWGGCWFEYMGTGSGTGDDSYKIHFPSHLYDGTGGAHDMLDYFGVPYNKVWSEGENKVGIKVPGGALLDKHWPWSGKLGYPTQWTTHYYIWTEEDPTKREVSYGVWQDWIVYIDVHGQLSAGEVEGFMSSTMNQYKAMHGGNSALRRGIEYSSRSDIAGLLADIELFYEQRGWALTISEKQYVAVLWGNMWTMILDDDEVFNRIWFRFYGYL